MDCLVCGKPTRALSGVKLKSGKICKGCVAKLPSLMLEGSPYLQEYTLKHAMSYVAENMEIFCATASYGHLHIDSIHGLFCIAKSLTPDGKPKSGNNVFSIYQLTEVGLTCASPRTDHNNVLADIEFSCRLEDPYISVKTIIKKGVRCHTKRVDSEHVSWEEPSDLSMFRAMFDQMLCGAYEQVNQILCGKTVYAFELEKARAIFMLPRDYTAEDLKKARRLMMKVYHPDKADVDVTREAQIINDSYDLLKADLERREHNHNI
jgi:hypothetical protein